MEDGQTLWILPNDLKMDSNHHAWLHGAAIGTDDMVYDPKKVEESYIVQVIRRSPTFYDVVMPDVWTWSSEEVDFDVFIPVTGVAVYTPKEPKKK